ncbi:MAG: trigger factor [Candidatus Omnitrophica bacterium]|nr:trigger factor [Candidatus Omnitrophota bacterium]
MSDATHTEHADSFKATVKDGKGCEKLLSIHVNADLIAREYDEFYRSMAPKAKISGFRQGKVPRKVLEMHYQQEAREEVLKHLISESYRWAVKENELEPLLMPDIQDVKFTPAELSFKANVEVRPKIKINKVEGLSAKKQKSEVSDKEIQEQLNRIREGYAQFKAVEDRAAKMGDFVIADYVCTVDGNEVDKREGDWLEIREDEFLQGFTKQLVGVKGGETREVKIKFPEKIGRPELRGKEGVFTMQVKEIKQKELPALDDELAKDAGEFKTLDELKQKIKDDLTKNKDAEAEMLYEKELLKELAKHNKIELPRKLVERRLNYLTDQAKQEFMARGGSEEDFKKEEKEMAKELEKEAAHQVHTAFLLDEIANREKLKVEEQDVKDKMQQTADRFKRPFEEIVKYYEDKEDALHNLVEQIRSEKAIEFVKQQAKGK